VADLYAVIGGSGLYSLDEDFVIDSAEKLDTPYGQISAELQLGRWHGQRIAFLPRHGTSHQIPPHRINYRANIWALKNVGVTHIIAANAVGGISHAYSPQALGLPDQIIDYSSNREHTFFDGNNNEVKHIDFTEPYSQSLRAQISQAAKALNITLAGSGIYGCTNGPRFESAAEIRKMRADGSDMIGMTGMPEAALARELDIEYAAIALVVNWCAGIDDADISMDEIYAILEAGVDRIRRLIHATLLET
jgi:5'-methylthioinosine phosphorylase